MSVQPEIRPCPLAALALEETPTELHFVRSHFGVPPIEARAQQLAIGGAVRSELRLSLTDLRGFPRRTRRVVLECAGHRRDEFEPPAAGVQWGVGAVSEARWTGVALADVLAQAGPLPDACELVFEGADRGPHRSASSSVPFARSIPLERAFLADVLLAWEMNGAPIPAKHGAPLRAIVPGYYGVDSVKWLRRIEVLRSPFEGPFQMLDYRVDGRPLHELRINALVLSPVAGSEVRGASVEVSGVAWGGEGVAAVEVRVGSGAWTEATITPPPDPSGLTRWRTAVSVVAGPHVLAARAIDRSGNRQPERARWNPLGYANNSAHEVAFSVREERSASIARQPSAVTM